MRDAFFDRLYETARKDRNIFVVSADMGAPSLDKFRADLGSQYINIGVAEHNMITVASGLALSGKKVFAYAIVPFATLRCFEATRTNLCFMDLPVTIVGVGAGFSYDDSGPTHHAMEDIAVMRTLPNLSILNVSDSVMAAEFADTACQLSGPSYVRLDREVLPVLYNQDTDFTAGLIQHKVGKDLTIIATGNMVHRALEVAGKLAESSLDAGVIDIFRLKPVNAELLLKYVASSKKVATLEEHFITSGLGTIIAEVFVDYGITMPLKRIGINDKYCYNYGGRNNIQAICGLDANSVTKTILEWVSGS